MIFHYQKAIGRKLLESEIQSSASYECLMDFEKGRVENWARWKFDAKNKEEFR
jgi:hypothetical protein